MVHTDIKGYWWVGVVIFAIALGIYILIEHYKKQIDEQFDDKDCEEDE